LGKVKIIRAAKASKDKVTSKQDNRNFNEEESQWGQKLTTANNNWGKVARPFIRRKV